MSINNLGMAKGRGRKVTHSPKLALKHKTLSKTKWRKKGWR
jgi:hypothetical protein